MFVPLVSILAAWWADREGWGAPCPPEQMGGLPPALGGRDHSGLSQAMGARVPQGGYGILPVLVGEGVVIAGPWVAAAAGPVIELGVLATAATAAVLAKAFYDAVGAGTPGDWSSGSESYRTATSHIAQTFAKNGHPIDPGCAWKLSAQTMAQKSAQIAEEVLKGRRLGGGGASVVDAVNKAWIAAQSLATGLPAFEAAGNVLGIPNGAGVLTQVALNAYAGWWARFQVGLAVNGVGLEDLSAIETALKAAETGCMRGVGNTPKGMQKAYDRMFYFLGLVRRAFIHKLAAFGFRIGTAVLGATIMAILADAVRTVADHHHGIFVDIADAFDNVIAEGTGQVPPGKAFFRAEALEGYLLDDTGEEHGEGLINPGRYTVAVRGHAGGPVTPVQSKGKPQTVAVKEGLVYTLYLHSFDPPVVKLRDDAPEAVPSFDRG